MIEKLLLSACLSAAFFLAGIAHASAPSPTPGEAHGNLGGVAVSIPRHFANFLEYEGDPGWEARTNPSPPPVRTVTSKIKSFGFYVRFPDMKGQISSEDRADKVNQPPGISRWLFVGVSAGSNYSGPQTIERRASAINSAGNQFVFGLQAEKENGLLAYSPAGNDAVSGRPNKEHRDANTIYVHRTASGRTDAFVTCSNRPLAAAPCRHEFVLEPQMGIKVYIIYRRGLLPDWQRIQQAVSALLLSFRQTNATPR